MDIPHFISDPASETEIETAKLLSQHLTFAQVAQQRCLSKETIKAHARELRFKYHHKNIRVVLNRMMVLKHIPVHDIENDFPAGWRQYIKE